jgi:aminomethyltransferase
MATTAGEDLKRTPLYEAHLAAGARLVSFAGWEMPIDYGSLREEHLSVRSDVGVFDVSHMGQVQMCVACARACLSTACSATSGVACWTTCSSTGSLTSRS